MPIPGATILPGAADEFLLRRDITFLNHGSFGACPRPVLAARQGWVERLEADPIAFLQRDLHEVLTSARSSLAAFVGVDPLDLVFIPNATVGANIVARSLAPLLAPGDEVLATDHEYGAAERAWRFALGNRGAALVSAPVTLPIRDAAGVVEQIWSRVTSRTRVLFISHITSPTALIFPVAELCCRARAAGIITVIDGAHAPGQIDLRLADLDVDYYFGNCHKWLCAPKSAGFLFARRERQDDLQPLVVSWGWESATPGPSRFQDYFGWPGTGDFASYLAVPDAIAFQAGHDWPAVRAACHDLVADARRQIDALTGLEPICPDGAEWLGQMAAVALPPVDAKYLQRRLWDDWRIEVPIVDWHGRQFVRVSIQGYNAPEDVARLVAALAAML